jgi:hypothetical protein
VNRVIAQSLAALPPERSHFARLGYAGRPEYRVNY